MTDIKITIDSTALNAELARLLQAGSNLQPMLGAIGHDLAENIRLGFRDQVSPSGIPWAALSPVTVAKRRNNSSVPLNDTGRLANSITHNVIGNSVEIGTKVAYAAMMNFGGKKSAFPHLWGDIPAREFMPVSQLPADWQADILTILAHHFSF